MKSSPLKTAVLFLVYNRLDTTKQVFEAIRQTKPLRLYIASDGPKEGEAEKVQAVREYLTSRIDWDCEIKTLFREKNLGCRMGVSSAITWFFENEEKGIILEDDCLPSQSFFWFCEELLERYKDDMRVWHIAGNNFLNGYVRDPDYSYYFSYYGSIWGWASWANRWNKYDVEIKSYPEIRDKKYLWDVFGNWPEAKFRTSNFDSTIDGFNTWDYQWNYARFINSGLSIVPNVNLIKNIGFGKNATHTHNKNDPRSRMPSCDIQLPLNHPAFLIRDKISDDRFFKRYINTRMNSIKNMIKKIFK